ncbi:DUF397 domain-containing protein [Amycolatopsis camponoti]|uniref:DUF397 domain-containing protein n=1 Tax=Amycolatopsis camponoti TaxID=2606593 RepID=UPI0012D73F49|nr:DUF397 domain-containing protein [Amycolatopsis camponoti]
MTKKELVTALGGWQKSSHSSASGSCVETRNTSGATLVRDSKDRRTNAPVLTFKPESWAAFLSALTPEDS